MKKTCLRSFYVAVLMVFSCLVGRAEDLSVVQEAPEQMAGKLGVKLPSLPWHVADVWWKFEKPIEHFESLSMEVTIDRDVPTNFNLYISPVGIAKINGMDFYGGFQTGINGWVSRTNQERVFVGKGAIFSRWSHDKKKPIGLDFVRMPADGLCESAGYEGEFCSVRRPVAWTKGSYTYSVVKGDTEVIKGEAQTWFHCLVRSHATEEVTWIGSLRFEGTDFQFWNQHAAFVEVYSTKILPHPGIPKVNVTFGYPRLNGTKPKLVKASANYNVKSSPACARAKGAGDCVVVEVGEIFARKSEEGQEKIDLNAGE
ncbi:hypothetical protein [Pedosphaera parvula]|uniref:AttH domain-containing protein n=1 Tax=Pedosphaera parvula (strain Ellin514) TaxID=320771 RepID=B9XRR6_PEDPL|nr:hypothetical protein [Pedosphaera parvula]EEF57481.1 hypothetical protein Cflav_PD0515 [Pedosphaera parvula Ellin514]